MKTYFLILLSLVAFSSVLSAQTHLSVGFSRPVFYMHEYTYNIFNDEYDARYIDTNGMFVSWENSRFSVLLRYDMMQFDEAFFTPNNQAIRGGTYDLHYLSLGLSGKLESWNFLRMEMGALMGYRVHGTHAPFNDNLPNVYRPNPDGIDNILPWRAALFNRIGAFYAINESFRVLVSYDITIPLTSFSGRRSSLENFSPDSMLPRNRADRSDALHEYFNVQLSLSVQYRWK